MKIRIALIGLGLQWLVMSAVAQSVKDSAQFNKLYQTATDYINADLYGEGATVLDEAIDFAEQNNLEREYLNALVTKAELFRKTQSFPDGIEVLRKMPSAEKYPKVQVRKLGRIAAIFHEWGVPQDEFRHDTVRKYLDRGLEMARANKLLLQEAELLNELGYLECNLSHIDFGYECLLKAAKIFENLGEWRAYANTIKHLMMVSHFHRSREKTDSFKRILLPLLNKNDWYEVEIDGFNKLSVISEMRGDSIKMYKYHLQAGLAHIEFERARHSEKLAAYKVLQETEKLRANAELAEQETARKEADLAKEQATNKTLYTLIAILVVLIIIVLLLLLREYRLRQQKNAMYTRLEIANENYHMLMVESNHRIKNNLQMIISMLEFASIDQSKPGADLLRKMSSKIHTISALHKHLYADIHNPEVNLKSYFEDIISIYTDISTNGMKVESHVASIPIKSERIVYFGLILNEMLSNTLEHCKAPQKKAYIDVKAVNGHFEYAYYDNSKHEQKGNNLGTGHGLITQLIKRVEGEDQLFDPEIGKYKFSFYG
ncbi:MAG: sensor histidine kinase [Bacteroidetes bacterium]|nr:sensor histidine kinase [Bacteroidota bacterium]